MTSLQQQLATAFPSLDLKFDYPLANITYFKLGGPAEAFVDAKTVNQILQLVQFCRQNQLPFRIIGGASNLIAPDAGLSGLTVRTANQEFQILPAQLADGSQLVQVGVGYKTALFVRQTIDHNLGGLEYFLGVPGTVGGAIYNNAHYLSDLIGDFIYRVQVITPESHLIWLEHDECDFSYDHSRFQTSGEIVVIAEFALKPGDKEASMAKVIEATRYRAKTQPLGEPSSGCIFQNVPNTDHLRQLFPQFADQQFVPGGFLIDQAGLKGAKEGGIEVSHKHAAFFVNTGQGTAAEVEKLIEKVKNQVKQKFGATLREEVFYLR